MNFSASLTVFAVVSLFLFAVPSWASATKNPYELGLAEAEENMWQTAIVDFSKAIKQNPNDDDSYQQRARCYMQLKKYPEAFADCNAALKINPHKARTFGYRGFCYLNQGQYQNGIEDCKQSITLDHPDELDVLTPGCYVNLEKALRLTGHPELALQYGARARNLDLIKRAKEARENKDMDLGFRLLDKAIANNPRETSAFYVRGIFHNNKSESEKALADLSTAIKLEPKLVPAYYFRADVYSQLGRHRLAIQDYDRILAFNPRLVVFRLVTETGRLRDRFFGKDDQVVNLEDIYYLRGSSKRELGDKLGALQDFEIAFKLDPNDSEANSRIAELQSQTGHRAQAIKTLSASVDSNKQDWQTLASRARVYEAQKDYKRALADYSRIIQSHPKEPGAYFFRAQLSEKLGDLKGAIKDYSQMIALRADDDDAYKCRGDCYLLLGDYNKAIADYSSLIKHDPNGSSSVYAARATAYDKSHQKDLAAKDRAHAVERTLRVSDR